MHGWLLVWSPPPRPLCPTITHTHSGTGGVGHGGAWWCACALCVPPTPPSHSPSLPPPPTLLCHHRPHTHTRDLVHAPLPHTHATCTTTHTKACCVLTTPCHTHHHPLHPPIHTHTTWHTHTASATLPQWCLPSLTTPYTHTTQETDQGQAHHWLWLFVSHHHHAGLALSLSCLLCFLSTSPFSLSLKHALTRPSCAHHHHHAIHPVCGVCCVLWGWTAPSTTVVVKHATHTLVDHCVDGSHHPTLHPPSTLTPFCAFATTNHHAIPLLQPPPHTTRPLCSSTAHSSASHTHGVDGMCLCGCSHVLCVVCVDGMHIPSHRPHTQPQPLWLCPSPHHHSLVCVDGNTCHMTMPNHQPLTCMAWSSRFLHKCVQSSPLPSTLCVWWIGGWLVLVWPLV